MYGINALTAAPGEHGNTPRPSASDVSSLISGFAIHGGTYQCDVIAAVSSHRMIGTAQDEGVIILTWYRCTESGAFDEIKGVNTGFYQPSADDVGSRLVNLLCS